jgi:hypothetical protein
MPFRVSANDPIARELLDPVVNPQSGAGFDLLMQAHTALL